jgi:hypothetical protein
MRFAALLAAGVLGAATIVTLAVSANASTTRATAAVSCSDATLSGTYTFAGDGWSISHGKKIAPFALAGIETYDGAGHLAGTVTVSQNGVAVPGRANTGTYHVNPDCTGTAIYINSGVATHYDIYLAPAGDSFQLVELDPGTSFALTEIRVSV